jgi:DNA-binding CsgD family transcriptional regulator
MLPITPVERAALQWLADGQTLRDIAGRLLTSESELEAGLASLFVRMGVADRGYCCGGQRRPLRTETG